MDISLMASIAVHSRGCGSFLEVIYLQIETVFSVSGLTFKKSRNTFSKTLYLFNCFPKVLIKMMLKNKQKKNWFSHYLKNSSWLYHADSSVSFNVGHNTEIWWEVVGGRRNGVQSERDRAPGLADLMQFAQVLYHLSKDQRLLLLGVHVGLGWWNATPTYPTTEPCSPGSFGPREFLRKFSFRAPCLVVCFSLPYLFPYQIQSMWQARGLACIFRCLFFQPVTLIKPSEWSLKHWRRLWVLQGPASVRLLKYKVKFIQSDDFGQ